jgi:hypothetical protein
MWVDRTDFSWTNKEAAVIGVGAALYSVPWYRRRKGSEPALQKVLDDSVPPAGFPSPSAWYMRMSCGPLKQNSTEAINDAAAGEVVAA